LTVLFGPIGLIKHGKNVDIPAGTALTAYVDQDIWLAPINLLDDLLVTVASGRVWPSAAEYVT
jgi:hypothetical protein